MWDHRTAPDGEAGKGGASHADPRDFGNLYPHLFRTPAARPEVADTVESLPLEEGRLEQLEHDIEAAGRQSLVSLLREYRDVFTFGQEEMPGIVPTVMEHRLNADPRHKPFIQKKCYMGPERAAVANTKVQKLLEASFIREC